MKMIVNPARKAKRLIAGTALSLLIGVLLVVSLALADDDMGSWNATELQLFNIALFPKPVTVSHFTIGGNLASLITDTLPAQGSNFYSPAFQVTGTVDVEYPGRRVFGVVTHWDVLGGGAQWPLANADERGKTIYLPRFEAGSNFPTWRIRVHNLNNVSATVQFNFLDVNGQFFNRTVLVPALNARFLDRNDLNLNTFQGSVVAQASERIYINLDRRMGTGFGSAYGQSEGGFEVVAPFVAANFNGLNSTVVLQNASALQASGMLSFYHNVSGQLLATQTFTIPASASFSWSPPVGPAPTYGHVFVKADRPLASLVLGENGNSSSLFDYNGLVVVSPLVSDTRERRIMYAPVTFSQYQGWHSLVHAANVSPLTATMRLSFSSSPTGTQKSFVNTVPPHGIYTFSTANLGREFEHASLTISSTETVAAVILDYNPISAVVIDQYMAYEAQYATRLFNTYLPLVVR